jgi:hypothetical protein
VNKAKKMYNDKSLYQGEHKKKHESKKQKKYNNKNKTFLEKKN